MQSDTSVTLRLRTGPAPHTPGFTAGDVLLLPDFSLYTTTVELF